MSFCRSLKMACYRSMMAKLKNVTDCLVTFLSLDSMRLVCVLLQSIKFGCDIYKKSSLNVAQKSIWTGGLAKRGERLRSRTTSFALA